MPNATELMRQGKKDQIWQQYCGFIDLSIDEFMDIQKKNLLDQIKRFSGCKLGKKILGEELIDSVEKFQELVPFTKYEDYADILLKQDEDALPEKPFLWVHTSGRSGEYPFKWLPYTQDMYDIGGKAGLACFILSACRQRGHVALREQDISMYSLAPPPYISGLLLEGSAKEFAFRIIPEPSIARNMDFQERIQMGFRLALKEGLDFFYGITSILLRVSEQFGGQSGERSTKISELGLKSVLRMVKALVKSKILGRPMLPKDIFKVKGVLCGGTDTSIFKEKVEYSWGRQPLEVYASTEFGITATQVWNYQGLTFYPYNNFWEFIEESDYRKMRSEDGYKPKALTLDQVKPNTDYVIVGTNFHGGVLTRCIIGDLIRITSLEDRQSGIKLPQMVFSTRIDDVIDIGGFTRLTEKTIWKAIEDTEIPYVDWTVRKEYQENQPILNLYIELKDPAPSHSEAMERIHVKLKELNEPYRDLETMGGLKPLKVTPLAKGTFSRYFEERQAAGADLAHLKPSHMNPSNDVIENLLRMSAWKI